MANQSQKLVYKLVLTGGPCGGKTTGQSRLSTFFENLGWKVFRVPETATVLLSGGIKFADLSSDEAVKFQENLLKTMIQIENTFFELGRTCQRNCLIICDRGAMDASAFISKEKWEVMCTANNWNSVELRDNRYNHIVHMVSAANGAEDFYSVEDHACRSEGMELARELDYNAAAAWIGHPYFDVIDNSTDFDKKMNRLIACVCQKIGIDTGDRLNVNSKKRKFLVKSPIVADSEFPAFQDFDVVHNYLQSDLRKAQVRLRKRGQKGHWSYIHTLRKFHPTNGQSVEVRTQLTHRDYLNLLPQRDDAHFTIFKKRRCFIFNNQYYQLDMYRQPTHPRCRGLVLLETYSAAYDQSTLIESLPKFLIIEKEVTGDPAYSMYNLSLKEDWKTSKRYYTGLDCHGHSKNLTNGHNDYKPNGLNGATKLINNHVCEKTNGHEGGKINGHAADKDYEHAGEEVDGQPGDKVNGHAREKVNGNAGDKSNGHAGEKVNRHASDKVNGHAGEKVNMLVDEKTSNNMRDKINGHVFNKADRQAKGNAGEVIHSGEKINGQGSNKINGHVVEKTNGCVANRTNGYTGDKINMYSDKPSGRNNKMEPNIVHTQGPKYNSNTVNGTAHDSELENFKNTHRMDLGSPKITKVAVKI